MEKFSFTYLNNYKNHGQNAEQSVRFILTGELCKADNIKYSVASDCLNFQIKSARATICKGLNLKEYLNADASSAYIYASNDGIAYIMDRNEYEEFCNLFTTITRESGKNGGKEKLRLKTESKEMKEWLRSRA